MGALRLVGASLIALCLTAGCSVTAKGSFCEISRPIRLTPETVNTLTDAQVAEILSHNQKGAALCRWRP